MNEGDILVRNDGRSPDEQRQTLITAPYLEFPEGSALIQVEKTWVLCTATIEERVPAFLRGKNSGWVTAEYTMLPRSTLTRTPRDRGTGTINGRVQEIQRLIGRSLRSVTDLAALGPRTIIIDCDVLQADGGTRTAAITGAYVVLHQTLSLLVQHGVVTSVPLTGAAAAVSVGMVDGVPLLDLNYEEDVRADVDFNVVMNDRGEFIEVQGTAEGDSFSRETMNELLTLAGKGITHLLDVQKQNTAQGK
jgi:ribonuclease PH